MMRELRPDVLHANLPTPWSCQYALSAALLTPGVRTLAVHHAIALPETQASCASIDSTQASRRSVAVSVASAGFVERVVGLGEGAVRVIYNGVPMSLSPQDPGSPMARLSAMSAGSPRRKGWTYCCGPLGRSPTSPRS